MHGGLARSKMSVHMSVCLSVQRVTCNKKEKNYCPHFYSVWKINHLDFQTRRMVGGNDSSYLKFWAKLRRKLTNHLKNADFQSIFARNASASVFNSSNKQLTCMPEGFQYILSGYVLTCCLWRLVWLSVTKYVRTYKHLDQLSWQRS